MKPTIQTPDCRDDKQLTQDWSDGEEEEVEEEEEEKEVLEITNNDDEEVQEIYLISDMDDLTAFDEDDFADEELEQTDELSEPIPHAHVMYKYSVSSLLDDDMLLLFVKAIMSANFFWTRIGLSEEEALEKLVSLEVQLKDVLNDFMDREKEQCLMAARQIRHLKEAIHSVTADLEVLIGEQQLVALLCTLKEQESPHGAEQKVDSYLRVQKAALKVRLRKMLRTRNQSLQAFDRLKADCMATVRRLGLTAADALEPTVAAILEKRVANYEEVECLQLATDQLRAQLEERVAHCQALSAEMLQMYQLVPLAENIDQDDHSLLLLLSMPKKSPGGAEENGDCANGKEVIYSEERLHKLEKLHTKVHQAALKTWTELKETSEQLEKLYRLFEVVDPESRHAHFNLVEAVQVKLNEQLQQWQQHVNEEETEEETTEPQCYSFLLLQALAPFFADQQVTLKDALKELGGELAYYTQQKSERISELITACRAQFARQLADCLVSVEALKGDGRFGFLFTGPEHFDEHLLDVHQAELDRLRQYAAKWHEAILSPVLKWRRLKEEAAQLEEEMATGAHIRTNRGGILEKMLAKQRANKKQLTATTAQIGAWLRKQKQAAGQQLQQKSELDRLLPFELYSLRLEDIEREVMGPAVGGAHQRVQQSASVRRTLARSSRPTKLSLLTPSTAYSAGTRCSVPLTTPLYAKNKKAPVNKVKLFQSVSSTAKTSKYQQQPKQKWQPPSSSFSSWRTAYQAKNKHF